MARCKECDQIMPPLSKVCPFCKTIQEEEANIQLEGSLQQLEQIVLLAQQGSSSSLMVYMGNYSWILYLSLAVGLFVLAAVSMSLFVWGLVALFIVLFFFSLRKWIQKKKQPDILQSIVSKYEHEKKAFVRQYGDNKEVKRQLGQLDRELEDICEKGVQNKRTNAIISLVIILVLACILSFVTFRLSKAIVLAETTSVETIVDSLNEGEFEKALQLYPQAVLDSTDEGESLKQTILQTTMSNGDFNFAVSFFQEYCLGKEGDYNYALLLVKGMLNAGLKDQAYTFVEDNTAFYYPSDSNRLRKLVIK